MHHYTIKPAEEKTVVSIILTVDYSLNFLRYLNVYKVSIL